MPRKNELLLFLTGFNLLLLNFILVRHITVALKQPEIAVILFSTAYFTGISLGYYFSNRISLLWLRRLFPIFLFCQAALILFMQPLAYIVGEKAAAFLPNSAIAADKQYWVVYGVFFLAITVGATSLYGVFLPTLIEIEGKNLRRCYSIEIIGSLSALVLLPVVLHISWAATLAVYFFATLLMAGILQCGRVTLLLTTVAISLFLLWFNKLDQYIAGRYYARIYNNKGVQKILLSDYSPYHKIEVLQLENNQPMLVLNGKRQFAHGSHLDYSYFVAAYPASLRQSPKVCVLGCGSMSTVGRIGNQASEIRIIDIDPQVFDASQRYFQQYNHLDTLTNWSFHADDAKHFLASTPDKFDLILHDIPPARSRQTALTYTREFFQLAKDRLTPNGIFAIASLTPIQSNSAYGRQLLATLADVFDRYFMIIYRRDAYFYGGLAGMTVPEKQTARSAILHGGRNSVTIFSESEIDQLVRRETIITINNVGDLIFAD